MSEFWTYLVQYIHKITVQITEQLSRQRRIQNPVKHVRWITLQKYWSLSAGMQPEIFGGTEGFVELGYFDKHFDENTRKTTPQENILEVFFS